VAELDGGGLEPLLETGLVMEVTSVDERVSGRAAINAAALSESAQLTPPEDDEGDGGGAMLAM
jgi:hypothetical protein